MGKVNVIIVDATGNKEQKVGLPDDVKCGITWSLHLTTRKAQNGSPLPKLKRHLVRICLY